MGETAGFSGQSGVLVTREVRWFFDGAIPPEILDWFQSAARPIQREIRVDTYDLAAARRRVGLKVRSSAVFDSKLLVTVDPDVELGFGMRGHVEDWMKITEPAHDDHPHITGIRIEVVKDLLTRRYELDSPAMGEPAGCEVELASITAGAAQAWTICFETFGPPDAIGDAFDLGVLTFLAETPLPEGFQLVADRSWSYPEWLVRREMAGRLASDG